ncbi:hypothetical protein [Candidatus Ichthyocystis hellenicum]|uniref:hypothetical protein n=1 Tax=Candidatus Ichthyocystis hellenicum TaxID=1561003 RepID=UPI00158519D1|nr:hypothetical protein [Candidatus Ichthyocystis hellenicum]
MIIPISRMAELGCGDEIAEIVASTDTATMGVKTFLAINVFLVACLNMTNGKKLDMIISWAIL